MGKDSRDRDALDRIFGAELPQRSRDELDPADGADSGDRDRWLRENVPPHHI